MTIKEDLMTVKSELYSYINHSYLMKHIDEPWIDDDKLLILFLMFRENGTYASINPYIHSVMLVQLALDIHDTIHIVQPKTQQEIKNRQLTVLAGDYYSSLYYRLLAEESDTEMTAILAQAIQVINEYKMSFYKNEDLNLDEKLNFLKNIESYILVRVSEALNLSHWTQPITDYFYLKRLQKEREHELNHHFSLLFDTISYEKQHLLQLVEASINRTKKQLVLSLKEHPILLKHLYKQPLHILTEA